MPGSIDPSFNCRYFPPQPSPGELPPEDSGSANVTILPSLPPPPVLPPGISPEQVGFPYLEYKIRTRYKWKQGTLELPVAKTPAPLPDLEELPPPEPVIPDLEGFITNSPGNTPASGIGGNLPSPPGSTGPGVQIPQYGGPLPPVGSVLPTDNSFDNRPAAVIVQVSAPYGYKIVEFKAVRLGAQPVLPDPTPKCDNEVLDEADTEIWAPIPTPDGNNFVWVAMGVYRYKLVRPYWPSDGYVGGATPIDNTTLDLNWYPATQYSPDLA